MSSLPPLPPNAPVAPPQTFPIPIQTRSRRSPSPGYRGGGSLRDDGAYFSRMSDSYVPGTSFDDFAVGPGSYRRDSFGRDQQRPPYMDRRARRSRSPVPYDNRYPRRQHSRSPSRDRPRDRDRDYDRYRVDRRDPSGGAPLGGYTGGRAIDPNGLETLVLFRQFADWYRFTHPDEVSRDESDEKTGKDKAMSERYETYKKQFQSRQLWALYLTHKNEAWFKERYSVDEADVQARQEQARKGRSRTTESFLEELEKGEWDGISYTQQDPSGDVEMPSSQPPRAPYKAPDDGKPGESQDLLLIDPPPNQIFIKTIGPEFSRSELEEVLTSKTTGFDYLALSDPSMKKMFHRVGWAQFKDGTDMDEVVKVLDGMELRHFTFHIVKNTMAFTGRIRYTPELSNKTERLQKDYAQARAMAIVLEKRTYSGISTVEHGDGVVHGSDRVEAKIKELWDKYGLSGSDDELKPEQANEKARIGLDLFIAYLRNGLNTCYYCVAPCDYREEMYRRCIRHVRRPPPKDMLAGPASGDVEMVEEDGEAEQVDQKITGGESLDKAETVALKWSENVDSKVPLVTMPERLNPVDYGGKAHEEESKKISATHIKQEEASKYRCKLCSKLFKAPEFLYKHIPAKHPSEFDVLDKTLPVFNNFVLDPQRLQPQHYQPASVDDKLPINPVHPPPNLNGTPSRPGNGGGGGGGGGPGRGGRNGGPRGTPLADRMGGYARGPPIVLPLGPPGAEDPRAGRTRVSYRDLDAVPSGAGDGGLPY